MKSFVLIGASLSGAVASVCFLLFMAGLATWWGQVSLPPGEIDNAPIRSFGMLVFGAPVLLALAFFWHLALFVFAPPPTRVFHWPHIRGSAVISAFCCFMLGVISYSIEPPLHWYQAAYFLVAMPFFFVPIQAGMSAGSVVVVMAQQGAAPDPHASASLWRGVG